MSRYICLVRYICKIFRENVIKPVIIDFIFSFVYILTYFKNIYFISHFMANKDGHKITKNKLIQKCKKINQAYR